MTAIRYSCVENNSGDTGAIGTRDPKGIPEKIRRCKTFGGHIRLLVRDRHEYGAAL